MDDLSAIFAQSPIAWIIVAVVIVSMAFALYIGHLLGKKAVEAVKTQMLYASKLEENEQLLAKAAPFLSHQGKFDKRDAKGHFVSTKGGK